MTTYTTISSTLADGITTITLNRPERKNAINPVMVNELLHTLDATAKDKLARVVVLTGVGKAFCSGGDFGQMSGGGDGESSVAIKGDYSDLLQALSVYEKPLIAKVNGPALGGGLGLVASCHFAIATDSAELGTPEINVGLFPMMIMAVLAKKMPRKVLLDWMLLGKKVTAANALASGLLSDVVPGDQLDGAVRKLCDDLIAKSPTATARGLRAFAMMSDLTLQQALPKLRDELYALLATDDAQEGLMAFMQKRQPQWKGE